MIRSAKKSKTAKSIEIKEDTIEKEINKILAAIARAKVSSIKKYTDIREDLGIDSLSAMEILAAVETRFKIIVDEAKAFDIVTVSDLYKMVKGHISKK
ncbi:acyl carrier protein [Candidatus Omnitrophota bacterium]